MGEGQGYLWLKGIHGGCAEPRFQGCLAVSEISMMQDDSARGAGTGAMSLHGLYCCAPLAACVAQLFRYSANGGNIASATLTWLDGAMPRFRLNLRDVTIDNFSTGPATMNFELHFAQVAEFQTLTPQESGSRMRLLVRQTRR